MANSLLYPGSGGMIVEIGDMVTARLFGGREVDGEVTAIYPRKRQVKVRYEDYNDFKRTTGEPRQKVGIFGLSDVDLERRTM